MIIFISKILLILPLQEGYGFGYGPEHELDNPGIIETIIGFGKIILVILLIDFIIKLFKKNDPFEYFNEYNEHENFDYSGYSYSNNNEIEVENNEFNNKLKNENDELLESLVMEFTKKIYDPLRRYNLNFNDDISISNWQIQFYNLLKKYEEQGYNEKDINEKLLFIAYEAYSKIFSNDDYNIDGFYKDKSFQHEIFSYINEYYKKVYSGKINVFALVKFILISNPNRELPDLKIIPIYGVVISRGIIPGIIAIKQKLMSKKPFENSYFTCDNAIFEIIEIEKNEKNGHYLRTFQYRVLYRNIDIYDDEFKSLEDRLYKVPRVLQEIHDDFKGDHLFYFIKNNL